MKSYKKPCFKKTGKQNCLILYIYAFTKFINQRQSGAKSLSTPDGTCWEDLRIDFAKLLRDGGYPRDNTGDP